MQQNTEHGDGIAARLRRFYQTTALLVLATLVTTGSIFGGLLVVLQPDLQNSIASARALRTAHQGMLNQESGLRGYLLTGEEDFLDTYRSGREAMLSSNQTLSSHIADDPSQSQSLLEVRLAQQSWMNLWAAQALEWDTSQSEAANDAFLDEGKELFDTYRVEHGELEGSLTAAVNASVVQQRNLILTALVVEGVLFALLLGVGLYQQMKLRQQVVQPVENLTRTMGELRDGNLDARAQEVGPWEMRQLAVSLTEMSTSLRAAQQEASDREDKVRSQAQDLHTILAFARDIAGSLSLRHILEALSTSAKDAAQASQVRVWLMEEEDFLLTLAHDSTRAEGTPHSSETVTLGEGPTGRAAQHARTVLQEERNYQSLCLPMVVGARVVGVLEMSLMREETPKDEDIHILETLTSHAGAALEAARLHSYTEELSQIDPLTRLYNRRKMETDMDGEFQRSRRFDRPMSFVMMDVDHFKRLNDTQGHRVGDEVLQQLGQILKESLRSTDTVYRYGGEEFSILLRETRQEDALQVAENLRAQVEKHFAHRPSTGRITVSLGVAQLCPNDPDVDQFIKAADKALYESKSNGRNQVSARSY